MSKTKDEPIRLSSDGELWRIPSVSDVENERKMVAEQAAEKAKRIEQVKSKVKDQMGKIMTRLEGLNFDFNGTLFLEVADQDRLALIGRRPFIQHKEQEGLLEAFYVLITYQGFYVVHFNGTLNRNGEPVFFSKGADFSGLVSLLPNKVEFLYQYIVFDGDKLRLSMSGTRIDGGFSYGFSSGDLEPILDEQLIQTCLDQALLPIEEEMVQEQQHSDAQDEHLATMERILSVASNIDSQLPLAEVQTRRRWWPFGRGKRKRQAD